MADNAVMQSISELPEGIIHHILSFLTTKEATKTSTLSKAWLKAWRTRPSLEFNYGELIVLFKHKQAVWDYITATLVRYCNEKVGIGTFALEGPRVNEYNNDHHYHLLDRCMRIVKKISQRNLNLVLRRCSMTESVFEIESLVEINLEYCSCFLGKWAIMCSRLKRLCLLKVSLDGRMFQDIIRSCPLIEILDINDCRMIKENLKVTTNSLWNLKHLKIRKTPLWLTLAGPQYQKFKSLLLCGVRIHGNFFTNFDKLKFPQLEDLTIQDCQGLQRIKISSHSLKKMQLLNNIGLIEAGLDVPNIVLFEYYGKKVQNDILPEFSFTTTSGRWVSRIILECNGTIDTSWFVKLKEFLTGLNQSQVFITVQFHGDVGFNPDDEMINSARLSNRPEIQEFYVHRGPLKEFAATRVLAILDGIFWTCHPVTIKHWLYYYDFFFMKVLHKMMVSRSDQGHSDPEGIRFWQSDLKGVKDIEIFRSTEVLYYQVVKKGRDLVMPGAVDLENTFANKGRRLVLPGAVGWENLWAVLETQETHLIGFNLDWRTPDSTSSPKRRKIKESIGDNLDWITPDSPSSPKRREIII